MPATADVAMTDELVIPMIIRGRVINDDLLSFGSRRDGLSFRTPDIATYIDDLVLRRPADMQDLYALSLDDVIDYLVALGARLSSRDNSHMAQACAVSQRTSGQPAAALARLYRDGVPGFFTRASLEEVIRNSVGRPCLEGWAPYGLEDGRTVSVRAFGARTVHINAGNSPAVAALCVMRNALTRGDAIVKSPSNDPLTAVALGLTMIDLAPDHPITRHYSVGYWRGGDTSIEDLLYRSTNIEKIVAWGGFSSMKHITKYLGPGLDLVPMDPKLSCTMIGKAAFDTEQSVQAVAEKLACDIGMANQEGCTAARVIYVESGTDRAGIARLNDLGRRVFLEIQALPPDVSAPHPSFDPVLRGELDALQGSDWYRVFGGRGNEGAVIVSQIDEPVDFSAHLGCRVANLVPLDDIADAARFVTIHTQTIGIYPEALKPILRDRLALSGAQRIVTLGHHNNGNFRGRTHDAIEPIRRMVRWVIDDCVNSHVPAVCAKPQPVQTAERAQ